MAKVDEIVFYICPYCRGRYKDMETAESCRDECIKEDADEVEEDYETVITCEVCEKMFIEEKDATECEDRHKEKDDMAYANYLYKVSRELLDKASKHPYQTRLID